MKCTIRSPVTALWQCRPGSSRKLRRQQREDDRRDRGGKDLLREPDEFRRRSSCPAMYPGATSTRNSDRKRARAVRRWIRRRSDRASATLAQSRMVEVDRRTVPPDRDTRQLHDQLHPQQRPETSAKSRACRLNSNHDADGVTLTAIPVNAEARNCDGRSASRKRRRAEATMLGMSERVMSIVDAHLRPWKAVRHQRHEKRRREPSGHGERRRVTRTLTTVLASFQAPPRARERCTPKTSGRARSPARR